jgi:imidazolonepropionase-like amidohydrolase
MRNNKGKSITIKNAQIFDGVSEQLLEGDIRIEDGRIVEIGARVNADLPIVDAKGSVVMPGLIDNHFHAYGSALNMLELDGRPLSLIALESINRLSGALSRGFTTVRDVAGGDIGLAMAIDKELIKSPRYFYTGAALSQTGGHGDARPNHLDICCNGSHSVEVVDGVDNLRKAVRDRFFKGAHAIKIMTSGGVISPSDPIRIPQYSAEEIRVVVDEAQRRGSYVASHSYSPESIIHSVENGVRCIEHGNLLDQQSAEVMAKHGAYLVPTLAAYEAMSRRGDEIQLSEVGKAKNAEVLDAGVKAVEIAHNNGIKIGFGTDLMGNLHDEQLQGIRLQHEAQSVFELLKSLTSVNAEILQMQDVGVIKAGAYGDLLILGGNPFEKPDLLWTENENRKVIFNGSLIKI